MRIENQPACSLVSADSCYPKVYFSQRKKDLFVVLDLG